jgi:hypothetical protein
MVSLLPWQADTPSHPAFSAEPFPSRSQFWGDQKTDQFNAVERTFGNGFPKAILGFNEPDGYHPGQANMDPQTAANLWKQRLQKYAGQGIKLGAPAIVGMFCSLSHSAAPVADFGVSDPGDKSWLVKFFNACDGCTFDFLPLHWCMSSFMLRGYEPPYLKRCF